MRAFVRFVAAISALAAVIVYLHFGSLSPCGVLREAVRERGGLAAILPDDIVDLGIAGQYGSMSPGRFIAVLMDNLRAPIAISAPSSQQRIAPMPQTTPCHLQKILNGPQMTGKISLYFLSHARNADFGACKQVGR